jgi:hypothetical protein
VLKSLAQGFLVATCLIWICNSIALLVGGDSWLGLNYVLIMLIPISSIILLKLKNKNPPQSQPDRWRNLLFAFQGVALSFWLFDILTTYYAIDVAQNSIELNPLGWPWGILGAAAFYFPILLFSYTLLFKIKEKISFYAAIPLTFLTVAMGLMNLVAGAQNFQVFVDNAQLASGVGYSFLVLAVILNLVVPLMLKRMITPLKTSLTLKSKETEFAAA